MRDVRQGLVLGAVAWLAAACSATDAGPQVGLGAVGADLVGQPEVQQGPSGAAATADGATAADTALPDVPVVCKLGTCPQPPVCFDAVCTPNGCSTAPKKDGSTCTDGVLCTKDDTCTAGVCKGVAYSCDDGAPCTADQCDGAGCGHTAAAAGTACDDGQPCTANDTCVQGQCKGGTDTCGQLLPAGVGASPCKLQGDLPKASGIQMVPWFTTLGVSQPIHLTYFPDGTDRMVVLSRPGQINLFANDPAVQTKKLVLDITAKISTWGEGGLLSVAFHPKFKQNRKFYVNYTSVGVFSTIVSEFTMKASDPEVADPASEKILLTIAQPYNNHDGGQILFDTEGYLLIGMGDGGSAGDPSDFGQNKLNLLAKMLRIDVNKAEGGKAYAIPPGNPFVGNAAYAPEIFALGMRNPWRFSIDRVTGTIWAGDVGQNLWEEIDIIEKGKNYGWRQLEGTHCFNPKTNCIIAGMTMPVAELPHGQANSITGGYVYRGSQNPGLYGAYLFGDYVTGKYWSTTPDGAGGWVTKELLDTADAPVSFGEDRDGELYVVQLFPAKIFKVMQQAVVAPPGPALPKKLSETKCFSTLQPLTPAPGVVPYEVNAPLWSDGAHKQRFFVLPPGAVPKAGAAGPVVVPPDATQSWTLPVGTLIIKHFAVGDSNTPAETRFMRRDADGWQFFTFRWNKAGTDADFWPGGGSQDYPIKSIDAGAVQPWTMPNVGQCSLCHKGPTEDATVLGVQTAQLNRAAPWAKGNNQLAVFAKSGLLSTPALEAAQALALPALAALDTGGTVAAPLGPAARAYLHANCAHCHRPGGTAPTSLDFRFGTALSQLQACNVAPQAGNLAVADAQILKPGAPQKSMVALRMTQPAASGWLMPQVAVQTVHTAGAKLVSDWIAGLSGCTGP